MNRQILICLLSLSSIVTKSLSQEPPRYAVIIDEIFADPNPPVSLPSSEFIEIRNVSQVYWNLENWKITNGTTTAVIHSSYILNPGAVLILCSNNARNDYSVFGAALGVSGFPSLGNDGDSLSLISPTGHIIHSVGYAKSWYHNDVKSEGGWSLEMIDSRFPCNGYSNWTASTNPSGGSPGQINSVDGENPDMQPPALLRTYTLNDSTIVCVFDEGLDSSSASSPENYLVDEWHPLHANAILPAFNEVELVLPSPMMKNKVYQVNVKDVTDCAGNSIGMMHAASAGIPLPPDSVIINEILFNPAPNGYDYVELYNKGEGPVDLSQLLIASRDAAGSLQDINPVTRITYLLFPGEFMALTENADWVSTHYVVKNPSALMQISNMPSLPDDMGTFVITKRNGEIVDQLAYNHIWQFPLIDNESGVSLERISYSATTQNPMNWTSAASTAGYGTPGYQNSESSLVNPGNITWSIQPKTFSPDQDGYEDYCFLKYSVPEPGWVANISLFDANGHSVRFLAVNATLGTSGFFRWDGLNDLGKPLPMGNYIVVAELFNLQGKKNNYKQVVNLVRKW